MAIDQVVVDDEMAEADAIAFVKSNWLGPDTSIWVLTGERPTPTNDPLTLELWDRWDRYALAPTLNHHHEMKVAEVGRMMIRRESQRWEAAGLEELRSAADAYVMKKNRGRIPVGLF